MLFTLTVSNYTPDQSLYHLMHERSSPDIAKDIREVLAVTSLYHLLPRQELAPLVSYPDVSAPQVDLIDFLPKDQKEVVQGLEDELNNNYENLECQISKFKQELRAFKHADIDSLRFKRPIFSSHSERVAKPNLSEFHSDIFQSLDKIKELDLVKLGGDREIKLNEPIIRKVPDYSDKEGMQEHIQFYRRQIELNNNLNESLIEMKNKKRCVNKKLQPISVPQTKDSRIANIYAIIEQSLDDEDALKSTYFELRNGVLNLTSSAMTALALNFVSLLDTNSQKDLDVSYLITIQSFCLRNINNIQNLDSAPLDELRTSLQACLIILHILNSEIDDRRLYMESYLGTAIEFLASMVYRATRLVNFKSLIPIIMDCLLLLLPQVQINSSNDQVLGKLESLVFDLAFSMDKLAGLEELRSSLMSLLIEVFHRARDQRSYIVNEALLKFREISQNKEAFPTQRLSNGSSVLIFSAMLVQFVVAYDIPELRKSFEVQLLMNGKPSKKERATQQDLSIIKLVLSARDDMISIFNQVVDFAIKHLQTAESNMKSTFSALFDDILSMSLLPDWGGAPLALSAIVLRLLSVFQDSSLPSALEPYILETLSKFGTAVLRLMVRNPDARGCDYSINEKQISEVRSAYFSYLFDSDASLKRLIKKSDFNFRVQRSLFFFTKLFDDSQTHHSFSIFYQISSGPSSHLSQEACHIFGVIEQLLELYSNGTVPLSVTALIKRSDDPKAIHEYMLLSESFLVLYDQFLSVLGLGLESRKAKLSSKAIRILSQLIDINQQLLQINGVSKSISNLLQDGSPLSRDAIIELIGHYMFTNRALLEKYYQIIGSRSHDDSVMIRKRVLRLMKRLFVESNSLDMKVYTSLKILKRIEDSESSVVDLARNTLVSLWCEETQPDDLIKLLCKVAENDSHVRSLLQSFVRFVSSNASILECFKNVIRIAFNSILLCIDTENTVGIVVQFKLVILFAEIDGHFVTHEDLLTLTPYISAVEGSAEKNFIFYILRIMHLVLPTCRAVRSDTISSLQSALLQKLTKFNARELTEAIFVIDILSRLLGEFEKPLKAAISSLKLLQLLTKETSSLQLKTEGQKIARVINLVGCFGATCDFESLRPYFDKQNVPMFESESIASMFARNLLYICQQEAISEVRVSAVKNLLTIAAFHPKLFTLKALLEILDVEIEKGSNVTKLEIVRGIMSFLRREDEIAKRRADVGVSSTKDVDFDPSVFQGTNTRSINDEVCSSITQRYLPAVLCLCLSLPEAEDPVLFLQLVLNLGLANPKLCVSTVIALEASPNKRIKKIATLLHHDLFQKHESLADRSYAEAFKLSVPYIKTITNGQFHLEPFFLRNVYKVISGTYVSKKKFILTLVKLFELELPPTNLQVATSKRDEIVYLSLNLLLIKYSSVEEICLILYYLDRTIMTSGLDLSDRVTDTIGSDKGEIMILENLQSLFTKCQSILALIQLRHNLATTYNIRPMLMETFRPNKADIELRQQPRIWREIDYSVSNLDLDISLSLPAKFGPIFTRLVQAIANYVV